MIVDRLRTRLITRAIRRKLPHMRPFAMLDIGCGYFATQLMANYGNLSEGWGIDLSIAETCKAMPRLNFLEGPVEDSLPLLAAERFDAVLFISVLEHLWDPLSALQQCHRALKEGATLLINVPTWAARPVLEFSAFRLKTSTASSVDDHKTYYSRRELWPLLVRAGFRPSRIRLTYQYLGMTLFGVVRK